MDADPLACEQIVPLPVPEANDECPNKTVVVTGARSDGLPLDAPYPKGQTVVTWTADDGNGNTATCDQLVIVNDATAPIFKDDCPLPEVKVPAGPLCDAIVPLPIPEANDECPDKTVVVIGARSDALPLDAPYEKGTTVVTWTADDGNGNQATCTQDVTVNDVTPPEISGLTVAGGNVDDDCEFTATFSATVTDNCCVVPGAVMVNVCVENLRKPLVDFEFESGSRQRVLPPE